MSVGITKQTTSALSATEISYLEGVVAQAYGVDAGSVSTAVEYVTSGTMVVDIPEGVSNEDAVAAITSAMSQALGVGEENIAVTIDPSTGAVTYTVKTNDFAATQNVQNLLQGASVANALTAQAGTVTISSVTPNEEITAQVTIVLDADEVTVPLQQAENTVDALLGDSYSAEAEGIIFERNAFLFE